jgi:hypothetical protein
MRVLFIGDVVGPDAVEWLAGRLAALRSGHGADVVIVDAENAGPDGASMTVSSVERLLGSGADVITGGNHAFDGPEAERVLAHERVVRPLNVSPENPGRGTLTIAVSGGEIRVVVLADELAMDWAPPAARMSEDPYIAWGALPAGPPTTIIEMHALSVMAKQSLAYALDGQVAAVLGTHTHEATAALHLLPEGTALVTDVGMTGPSGGPQGMDPRAVVERVRGLERVELTPLGPARGKMVLGPVLLEIEDGLTRSLQRVL